MLVLTVGYCINHNRERIHLNISRLRYITAIFWFFLSQPILAHQIQISVIDNNKKPVSKVVVYLEPSTAMTLAINNKAVEIAQIDKSFSPYIGVMQKGASVKFHNKDNITHHIYSPLGDNKFAFKINAGQTRVKNDFSSIGEIAMGCNIHDWMSGYLLVVDTPYFSKTNEMGIATVNVKDVGKYNVVVWHPQMNSENNRINQQVNVMQDMAIEMNILKPLGELPNQNDQEDFDFLSDY